MHYRQLEQLAPEAIALHPLKFRKHMPRQSPRGGKDGTALNHTSAAACDCMCNGLALVLLR